MTVFYLDNKREVAAIDDVRLGNMPPLSFFCQLGVECASLRLSGREDEIHPFVNRALANLIVNGIDLKNHVCFFKMIAAIEMFMIHGKASATSLFSMAFISDPSNIYVISLISSIYDLEHRSSNWKRRRVNEITMWLGREDVLLVGDSHVLSFNGVVRSKICYVGSHTMHHVGKNGLTFKKYEEANPGKYNAIAFSFGEIDARMHIVKQSEKTGNDFSETIDDVIRRYATSLTEEAGRRASASIAVVGLVPPIRKEDTVEGWFHGSNEDRLIITNAMNTGIRRMCDERGFRYIDMQDGFCDQDGFISKNYWLGDHHIAPIHYVELERRLMGALDGDQVLNRMK